MLRTAYVFCLTAQHLFEWYLERRQLRKNTEKDMPHKLREIVDEETFRKSRLYNFDKRKFSIRSSWIQYFTGLVSIAYLSPRIWKFAGSLAGPEAGAEYTRTIVWILLLDLSSRLIDIPLGFYMDFVIEAKHGFNKKTYSLFFVDALKTQMISVVFMAILVPPLVYLIRAGGQYFYIYVWGFAQLAIFVLMLLYPAVIQPLFNKFQPLQDETLREKIELLASEFEFPLKKLFQVDGSKRSSHSNAYFFGFGKNKRVVLFDTLLNHSQDEILAVLCHEIGHWKHSHVLKMLGLNSVLIFLLMWGYGFLVHDRGDYLCASFNMELLRGKNGEPIVPVIVALSIYAQLLTPINVVVGLCMTWMSRRNEFEADRFAVNANRGAALRSALCKLHSDNLGELNPDEWFSWYHYTHPSLVERLDAIDKCRCASDLSGIDKLSKSATLSEQALSSEKPSNASKELRERRTTARK